MSRTRSGGTARERGAKAGPGDWKRLVSAGAVTVAVAGTLILAVVLRAGPDPHSAPAAPARADGPARSSPERPAPERPALATPAPAIEAGAEEEPVLPTPAPVTETRPEEEPARPGPASRDPLAARSASDRDRLSSHAGSWTLQFARLCEREHAAALLAELGGHEELFLVERNGCYLVCWGLYGSADLARSAGDAPPTLTALPDRPFPKRVEVALR